MSGALNQYCQFLGYSSCSAMSTFEALVAFGAFAVLFFTFVQIIGFVAKVFSQR